MYMIRRNDDGQELEKRALSSKTDFQNDRTCTFRELLSLIGAKRDEEYSGIGLVVRKTTAVFVFIQHTDT